MTQPRSLANATYPTELPLTANSGRSSAGAIYRHRELSQTLLRLPEGIGAITVQIGEGIMRRFWSAAVLLGILSATPVSAWDRGDVDVLAVLPDVTPGVPSSVEGLTVGPDDNIYVPSFGFNATGAISGNAVLYVIKPNGNLVREGHDRQFQSAHARLGLQSGQRLSSGPRFWGRQGLACGSGDRRFVGLHRSQSQVRASMR